MTASPTFGGLLRHLRKRAGMTQGDLATAVGYSVSFVSDLEQNRRLPTVAVVLQQFIPALGLQEEAGFATHLVELAAVARGERPPTTLTVQRKTQLTVTETFTFPSSHLPVPPTDLIGREPEVKLLCNRLQGHSGRLLTLVGPPGVGKTRLGLAVASRLEPLFKDGAYFVPLAALTDPTLVAAELVATLPISDMSQRLPKAKLIEFLRRKELLLVLDNFEQIIAAAGLVAELLAECPGLRILVTSRERLHLRTEQRYQVPPLTLDVAVALFTQRAQAVDMAFELTAEQQPIVVAICQRLDCLPLAIELIAVHINLFSPQVLLARLNDRGLDVLNDGAGDTPVHQRTLRNAIHRSYALCNPEEQRLFRSLGVFVGGFDLAAVLDFGFAEITLQALVHKNLVKVETRAGNEPRFLLLETLREYALEQLAASDEINLTRQRHYVTYLNLFRTGDSHLRGPEDGAWLARLAPDHDNLRAALQWTLNEKRYVDTAWLMLAAGYFWYLRGYLYEKARWLAQLLPCRQALAVDLRLATLHSFYALTFLLEEFHPVDRYRGEVVGLLENCTAPTLQAAAWHWLSETATDGVEAAITLKRAVALARTAHAAPRLGPEFCALADCDFILAIHLQVYADFLIDQGEVAQAAALVTESLAHFRMQNNRYGVADCLGTSGRLALLKGDLMEARLLLHEVMTISAAFNYHLMPCIWQPPLALATLYSGAAKEARRLLTESLRFCLELKNEFCLAQVYSYLAQVELWEGELEQAEQWLVQSLAYYATPRRITIDQVERLFVAARLATAQQQYLQAATLFGVADQMHSQVHYAIAGPMRSLADTALATARATLTADAFAKAFAAGQQLSLEEAFATILAPATVQNQTPQSHGQ